MTHILVLTAPIYGLIALGFAAVRTGYFDASHIGALSAFVIRICIPALVFAAVARGGGDGALGWNFMLGYAVASLAVVGIGAVAMRRFFGRPAPLSVILGLGMAASNSAFIGFPVASMVFGDAAIRVFAWIIVVENMIVIPLAVTLADAVQSRGRSVVEAVRDIGLGFLRNPLVVALAAGLLILAAGIELGEPVSRTLDMIVAVAPGVALFVVGGAVASYPLADVWGEVAAISAGKLVLHPLAVWGALAILPGIEPGMVQMGVLFAAMPMMSIFPIFARRYGGQPLAATALIGATVFSFVTVNLLILLIWADGLTGT